MIGEAPLFAGDQILEHEVARLVVVTRVIAAVGGGRALWPELEASEVSDVETPRSGTRGASAERRQPHARRLHRLLLVPELPHHALVRITRFRVPQPFVALA